MVSSTVISANSGVELSSPSVGREADRTKGRRAEEVQPQTGNFHLQTQFLNF